MALGPSSKAELRLRDAGADRLMGRYGCQGRGLLSPGRDCVGCNLQSVSSFVFLLFAKKGVFPSY
jgi:hypothetical protein